MRKRRLKRKYLVQDFPVGPVVNIPPPNERDVGSIPDQGAKIPHASQPKTKTENRSNIVTNSIKTLKTSPPQKNILKKGNTLSNFI